MRTWRNQWMRHSLAIVGATIVLLGMVVGSLTVRADDAAQFGIRPANPGSDPASSNYFVLKGQPGEMLHDTVVVVNPGTVPVKIALYPVDAVSGQNGGAVYMNNTDPRKDVGAWITLETNTVEVPPQKQATVGFAVAVPKETRAGQHLGGIAAQYVRDDQPVATALSGNQQTAGFGVTTVTRALTAVLLTVGDAPATPSLKITGSQVADVDGLPTLTLAIQNDGGALVKAKGEVVVTDATGATVLTNQFALDTLVPQTTIAYPIQAEPPATPGTYKVHATLDFGGSAPAVFDGNVAVTVKPTVTAAAGRSRLGQATAVAAANGNGNASSGATLSGMPSNSGGSLPLVPILAGLAGAFAVVVLGLVVALTRSRKRPTR